MASRCGSRASESTVSLGVPWQQATQEATLAMTAARAAPPHKTPKVVSACISRN
jgi:hypothetical protein